MSFIKFLYFQFLTALRDGASAEDKGNGLVYKLLVHHGRRSPDTVVLKCLLLDLFSHAWVLGWVVVVRS
jgi:hypothetical protein